eukprot:m.284369 g.284369  ORF g.284369 m.284369 type:complete len:392 (-) comp11130_c0_seq1:251-1426(-)
MLVDIPPATQAGPALASSPARASPAPLEPRRSPRKLSPKKSLRLSQSEEDLHSPLSPDAHDPVFDPELDDAEHTEMSVRDFEFDDQDLEEVVAPLIREYFESGDLGEVLDSLRRLHLDEVHRIVALVVRMGLDRKSKERELCSQLLSELSMQQLVRTVDTERAFDSVLQSLEDLQLDTPDAPDVVGCFLARAVADECLAPVFVSHHATQAVEESSLAKQAVGKAFALIRMRGGMRRLDTVWGISGAREPVRVVKKQMTLLLKEYLSSQDAEEAAHCLRDLDAPHFHHELVYEAILMALELSAADRALVLHLLANFASSNLITPNQIESGFRRIFADLPDIELDIPRAYTLLSELLTQARERGFIEPQLIAESPCRGRKRYLSENDGGRIKT